MDNGKKAIVIGATGLVGNHVVRMLLEDNYFEEVLVLSRRTTGLTHEKLVEHIIDFNDVKSYEKLVNGDVLFSCLGTTLKKAGSKDAQWKIDYTYQYEVAASARKNGVSTMVLVSSSGANSGSMIFYSKMKGALEEAIRKLNFNDYFIFRPSLLVGKREEERLGEKIGEKIGSVLTKIPPFRKYKPIKAKVVAKAMMESVKDKSYIGEMVFELDEIFKI